MTRWSRRGGAWGRPLRGWIRPALVILCAGVAATSAARAEELETPRALEPEAAVARTLASPRYRFCFDGKYPLWEEEVRWCELLPKSPDPHATRCPALADACRAGATARLTPRQEPLTVKLPNFGGLGQLVFWGMVALGVGAVVFLLLRAGLRLAGPRAPKARPEIPSAPSDAPRAANAEIEKDVDRLLARARAAAAAGDFVAAVSDLRAALLRRLEGDGHVGIHPSATNGDYVRELRHRAPTLASPVEGVVREVERVEFGDGAQAGAAYQSVLARIEPLLLRSAGRLAALVAACLFASSCQPQGRPDWASSPSGSAAVAQYLTAVGLTAHERIHPLKDLARETAAESPRQVVVLPDALMGDPEWTALRDWLTDATHTLVIAAGSLPLPAWLQGVESVETGAAEDLRADFGMLSGSEDEDDEDEDDKPGDKTADKNDEQREEGTDEEEGEKRNHKLLKLHGRVPPGAWLRTDVDPGETLISRGARPYAVLTNPSGVTESEDGVPMGRVIVLADERLLINASLVVADNAALLEALLTLGGGPIEIVNAETGLVAPNPVAAVARGRMAPFLLQLMTCLILFLLLRGRAFGRLVDRDVATRRVFGEHVRALGTQYARARAGAHALGAYAAWATDRLRERIRLSGDRGLGDLAGAVATRTGRPLGDVARVLFAARREGDAPDPGPEDRSRAGAQQQLTMMRELAQLLTETHATSGQSRATSTSTRPPTQKGIPTS